MIPLPSRFAYVEGVEKKPVLILVARRTSAMSSSNSESNYSIKRKFGFLEEATLRHFL